MPIPMQTFDAAAFRTQQPDGWSGLRWHLLAEGDSWFSLGSLNPIASANLLQPMAFSQLAGAVNCGYPGDRLRRMAEQRSDPNFVQLLKGNVSRRWDAILLSAGGNDLIEAANASPAVAPDKRLLRPAAEWGDAPVPERYFSEPGWQTFSEYFRANLEMMIRLRDSKGGPDGNRGRPLCMHTYAHPMPRPSGSHAGGESWLMPAMQRYGIPEDDWPALAQLMVDRLAELLLACAADGARFPALHVFDSRQVPLVAAALGSAGASGDWQNEIHLTHDGCKKVSLPWCAQIEQVMQANP